MLEEGAIKVLKLLGSSNYKLWAIRIKAALTAKDLFGFHSRAEGAKSKGDDKALSYIQLAYADSPLLYISAIETPLEAWNYLERLYTPGGFLSEFILFKEFFGATLSSLGTVENYLATIQRILTSLKAKKLELPNKLIIAWTLHNLGPEYDAFVASTTQTYRAKDAEINMDELFANLMDESRRLYDVEENTLIAKTRKPLRAKCGGCGKTGHAKESCYKLHPKLRLKRAEEEDTSPIIDILFASLSN